MSLHLSFSYDYTGSLNLLTFESLATNATATDSATVFLSIASIVVAAISPAVVILGIFVADWIKARRGREATKSLVIAYLNRISDQLPSLMAFFDFIVGAVPLDPNDLPIVEWSVKNIGPLDNEIYRKEISRQLLRLDSKLAMNLLTFNAHVEGFNDFLPKMTDLLINRVSPNPDPVRRAAALSSYLEARSEMLKKWKEYLVILEALIIQWKTALIERRKYRVSFDQLAAKNQEVLKSFFE